MKFKAFVINMKKNPDRLFHMTEQLNNAGIDFIVQEGIDGKNHDFTYEFDEALYRKLNSGNTMSPGEKGCALSHKRALEQMLSHHCDYALIMEDDIELPATFKKILDDQLEKRVLDETTWEYLSFNYPSVGTKAIVLWLFLFFTMFNTKKGLLKYLTLPVYFVKFLFISTMALLEGLREALYRKLYTYGKPSLFLRPLYLAGCYLVTYEGAKKLLETQGETLRYTADRLPNVARIEKNLRFYGFVPLQVIQRRDKFESNSVEKEFGERVKKFMGGRLLRE